MLKLLSQRLAVRLGLSVIIIETLFMLATGLVYYNNFSRQIDERQQERLRIASEMIINGGVNLSSLVDQTIMSALVGDEIEDAMLIDGDSKVAFSLNPAYRRMAVSDLSFMGPLDFNATTITYVSFEDDGVPYLASMQLFKTGRTGTTPFILYLRERVSLAEVEKFNTAAQLFLGLTVTVLVTSATIFWFFNTAILGRIAEMVKVFHQVENGDLSARSKQRGEDEIGVLQRGTNAMISRLEELVNGLEQRVTDRTRDLTVSAEVSRQIATILSEQDLLMQLAERTVEAFGFYQVSIFKYDANRQMLDLVAASGMAGEQMLTRGKSFTLDANGLVPSAARMRQAMVSNDVAHEEHHAPNPFLPETKSEATLPILFGGELLGVLDLQSRYLNRFSETDLQLFTAFANQIAVALRNASLFEQTEVARQQAEQADQAKSAFLASTSHELRTPLNAIINLTSFVRRGIMGPTTPRQEEILALVIQSGQNLLALINDVLDMSKIESGSLKLYMESDVDLKPIIASACATAESLLQDKPITLTTNIPVNLPHLRVDKHRVQQILLNILSNACKFTETGNIHLEVVPTDTELQFSIRDTGTGIAPEDHARVFQKFIQTESGLRQGGGTGLGMPITRSLVEAHGGQIWLESERGSGSTFYFTLPLISVSLSMPVS